MSLSNGEFLSGKRINLILDSGYRLENLTFEADDEEHIVYRDDAGRYLLIRKERIAALILLGESPPPQSTG